MENRAHAIIAVTFLVVFVVAALLIYHWFSNLQNQTVSYEIVTSHSVDGLTTQSPVNFKGIAVGHISSIGFDPADRSRVVVDIEIQANTYVTHATYAEVAMQGITGGNVLELKLGKGSRAPLKTSAAHPAKIPLRVGGLASIEASAKEDMQDLKAVLGSAKQLLGKRNRQHINASLAQLDEVTRELAVAEKQLPGLLEGAQRSVAQSHALLANANQLVRTAETPVRNAAKLEASVGALARTTRQLSERLNRQSVPDFDALSASLGRTSRQLQQLLRELKAKPDSLIFGAPKPPPGPGEPGFDNGHEERKP